MPTTCSRTSRELDTLAFTGRARVRGMRPPAHTESTAAAELAATGAGDRARRCGTASTASASTARTARRGARRVEREAGRPGAPEVADVHHDLRSIHPVRR